MTRIYLLRSPNGIETWCWCCAECLKKRRALRWEVVDQKPPPPKTRLLCGDCEDGST